MQETSQASKRKEKKKRKRKKRKETATSHRCARRMHCNLPGGGDFCKKNRSRTRLRDIRGFVFIPMSLETKRGRVKCEKTEGGNEKIGNKMMTTEEPDESIETRENEISLSLVFSFFFF